MGAGSRKGGSPKDSGFAGWVKSLSPIFAALSAALAAALGLLAPSRIIPQPLADYRWIPSALILVAFVVAWGWRAELGRHIRVVTSVTALLLIAVVVFNIMFVRTVDYQNPSETVHYLVGAKLSHPPNCGTVPEVIIRQCGGDWSALSAAWGDSFVMVAVAYMICYMLFAGGIILSVGAAMERTPGREPHSR